MTSTNTITKVSAILGILALAACGGPTTSTTQMTPNQARLTKSINTQIETRVGGEVYFGFNDSKVSRDAQRQLSKMARFMIDNPQVRFNIIGHADAVGSARYNRDLGMRRANAVAAYLIRNGVSFTQLHTTISLGEEELAVSTDGREVRNRRVVIEVMEFLRAPITYAEARGRAYPVTPPNAINSRQNVCGGGGLVGVCADAALLNVANLDLNAKVSRDLRIELGLDAGVDPRNPNGSIAAGAGATVGNVVDATADVTGSVGGAVGGAVEGVGGAVGGLLGG